MDLGKWFAGFFCFRCTSFELCTTKSEQKRSRTRPGSAWLGSAWLGSARLGSGLGSKGGSPSGVGVPVGSVAS